jgi:hypothetical protein
MKTRNKRLAWTLCAMAAVVCKQAAAAPAPDQKPPLSAYDLENAAKEKQEAKDRQELVLAPPPGWRPGKVRRKIKLTLIPEKKTIRVGQLFRYRLEIQNVGREEIYFSERYPGFIKNGDLSTDHWFELYATPPGGKKKALPNQFMPSRESMHAPPDVREIDRSDFSLALQPGETLFTRPDSPPTNKFRDLIVEFSFMKPGIYRINAAYDDRPLEPDSEEEVRALIKRGVSREQQRDMRKKDVLDSLGFVESNVILLEVVP